MKAKILVSLVSLVLITMALGLASSVYAMTHNMLLCILVLLFLLIGFYGVSLMVTIEVKRS